MIRVSLQAQFLIPGRLPNAQTAELLDGNLCIPTGTDVAWSPTGQTATGTFQATFSTNANVILLDLANATTTQIPIANLNPIALCQDPEYNPPISTGKKYSSMMSILEGAIIDASALPTLARIVGGPLASVHPSYYSALILPDTLASASSGAWRGWTFSPPIGNEIALYQLAYPSQINGPMAFNSNIWWGTNAQSFVPSFSPDGRCTFASTYVAKSWMSVIDQSAPNMPSNMLSGGVSLFLSPLQPCGLWSTSGGTPAPIVLRGRHDQITSGYTFGSFVNLGNYGGYPRPSFYVGDVVLLEPDLSGMDAAAAGISASFMNGDQIALKTTQFAYPSNTLAGASFQIPKVGRDCLVVANWDIHNNCPVAPLVAQTLDESVRYQSTDGVEFYQPNDLVFVHQTARVDYLGTDLHGRAHHCALISNTGPYSYTNANWADYNNSVEVKGFLTAVVNPANISSLSARWFAQAAFDDVRCLVDITGSTPDGQAAFTVERASYPPPGVGDPHPSVGSPLAYGTFCSIEFLHIRRSDGLIGAIVVDTLGRSWYAVGALPLITGGYTVNNFRRGVR